MSQPSGETFAVARDGEGLAALDGAASAFGACVWSRWKRLAASRSVVAAAIGGAGCRWAVVNPAQVRHYAQALGKRAKTDKVDAAVIARFAEATKPGGAAVAGRSDAGCRRSGGAAAADRGDDGAPSGSAPSGLPKRLAKSCERVIRMLEKELAALDQEIDTSVRGTPAWREKEDLLASVPGMDRDRRPHA